MGALAEQGPALPLLRCAAAAPRSQRGRVPGLVLLLAALLAAVAEAAKKGQGSARQGAQREDSWFFYNELTGAVQWEDPGDVPFEDEGGLRYWLGHGSERLSEDPSKMKYSWVEFWSEDLQRPYFHNQETLESTWERPADLAWRRLKVPPNT